MNNICPSDATFQCNSPFIENSLLVNTQTSGSTEVKAEGQDDHDSRPSQTAAPIFIDLTQSSDEESDVEDLFTESESNDSDLEIISHRSRSPLTISSRVESTEVSATVIGPAAGSPSSSTEGSSGLSGPSIQTPSESHISVIQRQNVRPPFIFPISPVNPLALPSQTRTATESMQSLSPSSRAFHRPRDDVIDWLNEIEPFNPVSHVSISVPSSSSVNSTTSSSNSNGLAEPGTHWNNGVVDRQVHCGHCGHSVLFGNSNDIAQPSTSTRRTNNEDFHESSHVRHFRTAVRRHEHVVNNNSSVLERMLSTPPLPLFEDPIQQPSAINLAQPNLLPEQPLSHPNFQSHIQHFAVNFNIPPPAHSGNVSASVNVGRDFFVPNRSRIEPAFTHLSNVNPAQPDNRGSYYPAAAHASASTNFATNAILPTLRTDILSYLSGQDGTLPIYGHAQAHQEPIFAQSQRTNNRFFAQLNQPLPYMVNPAPVDFLPASVILQGFYPDFPGFGLSSTQIERHTVKYVLEKDSDIHCDVGAPAVKKVKASYTDESDASCSVCLEGFDVGQTMRRLTCQHLFHADCVDEWLKRRPTCPNCRVDVRRPSNNNSNNNNLHSGEPSSSTSTTTNGNNNPNFTVHHRFHIPHRNSRVWPFTTNH